MKVMHKPFSQACENNKVPILGVLERQLAGVDRVLEIGSGTGQHAVFFAKHLPHLSWLTTDLPDNHAGIRAWIADSGLDNVRGPEVLDARDLDWPWRDMPAMFSSNTAHIMGEDGVRGMFRGAGAVLRPGGVFCLYGPFRYRGGHTSPSNERFDRSLRARDPSMGVRDFEFVDGCAQAAGMTLLEDNAMPANNRLLVWRKQPPGAVAPA